MVLCVQDYSEMVLAFHTWLHQLYLSVSNPASFAFSVPCMYNIILARYSVLGDQQFILSNIQGSKLLASHIHKGFAVFLHNWRKGVWTVATVTNTPTQ